MKHRYIAVVFWNLTWLTLPLYWYAGQPSVGGFPVVISGVQLLSISTRLHHNLTRLAVSYFEFIILLYLHEVW